MVELGAIGRIIAFGKGVGNAIGTHPRLGGEPHSGARDVVNAERAAAAESPDPLVIAKAGAPAVCARANAPRLGPPQCFGSTYSPPIGAPRLVQPRTQGRGGMGKSG